MVFFRTKAIVLAGLLVQYVIGLLTLVGLIVWQQSLEPRSMELGSARLQVRF